LAFFYEINSVLEFRSAGFATPRAGAGEIVYDVLRCLGTRLSAERRSRIAAFSIRCPDAPRHFQIVSDQPAAVARFPLSYGVSSYILFVPSL